MPMMSDYRAPTPQSKPQKWPLCSDEDEFLYAESSNIIIQHSLPHRAVWGMLYSPARSRWLVKRPDAATGIWDASCCDHVLMVDSEPEPYDAAYARALRDAYGLETGWVGPPAVARGRITLEAGQVLSVDLGYSKEYNWTFTWERSLHLEREHVHMFLTLYDGEVSVSPGPSSASLDWAAPGSIQAEIDANNCTSALTHTFARCRSFVNQIGLGTSDSPA